MFSVYGPQRRRRHWSKSTIAVSVLAHGAAVAAIAASAAYAEARPAHEVVIAEWKLEEKPAPKPNTPPPPPKVKELPQPKQPPKVELAKEPEQAPRFPRARPQPPAPVKGDFVAVRPPQEAPSAIPAVNPNEAPVTAAEMSATGKEGDVIGRVDPADTRAPTGHTEPAKPTPEPEPEAKPEPPSNEPMSESAVDVRPSLRNADDVQSALQRAYPAQLRDAGVTGQTVIQFVIDEHGRVEPGSLEILSSTNDEFASAVRRVVSSMRFSPARSGGHSVRVTTSMPVTWTVSH
jgi:TonB family protein